MSGIPASTVPVGNRPAVKSTDRGGNVFRPCRLFAALLFAACAGPAPTTPERPLGPESLAQRAVGRFGFYSLPAGPERDRYVVDWSLGRPETTASFRGGETIWLDHHWPDTGRRAVRCRALDERGRISDWSEGLLVTVYNLAPAVPTLAVPETVAAGVAALALAVTTDPEGDAVVYRFDWGDGSETVTERYASGDTCQQYHTWPVPQAATVRVRARDDFGNWSDWSPGRSVLVLPPGFLQKTNR